eukprot:CAMPEP_0198219186 /NCGR_PEP_ID=MMETSP1445-20131203/72953_1 /TAXON_ID=36898 /ORGANISM="Pyramimonas sp., Strain CCMP2087" /LENGTH=54 /DNA_ID=CAMNT_0043896509 /DNA_START=132 /DNA_END=292 /DNA_ORIENTATION=+
MSPVVNRWNRAKRAYTAHHYRLSSGSRVQADEGRNYPSRLQGVGVDQIEHVAEP